MKLSRACPDMLSCENSGLILKNCENYKIHVHHMHHSSRAPVNILSLQTSLSLTRNVNVTVAKELYIIINTSPGTMVHVMHVYFMLFEVLKNLTSSFSEDIMPGHALNIFIENAIKREK